MSPLLSPSASGDLACERRKTEPGFALLLPTEALGLRRGLIGEAALLVGLEPACWYMALPSSAGGLWYPISPIRCIAGVAVQDQTCSGLLSLDLLGDMIRFGDELEFGGTLCMGKHPLPAPLAHELANMMRLMSDGSIAGAQEVLVNAGVGEPCCFVGELELFLRLIPLVTILGPRCSGKWSTNKMDCLLF